jgi:inorganic pyrophosphatase
MVQSSRESAQLFQSHPWHGVPAGVHVPEIVNVFIELVPTDTVKYEVDKSSGHIWLDRPQSFSSLCPMPYGFIPQTFCGEKVGDLCGQAISRSGIIGDGDPLDVCVLTDRALHGNLFLCARPIGGLRMIDGNEADDKIIAVLENDLSYGRFEDISDCPVGIVNRLIHYFLSYKQLPGKQAKVEVTGTYDRHVAHDVIRMSMRDYEVKFGALHASTVSGP